MIRAASRENEEEGLAITNPDNFFRKRTLSSAEKEAMARGGCRIKRGYF